MRTLKSLETACCFSGITAGRGSTPRRRSPLLHGQEGRLHAQPARELKRSPAAVKSVVLGKACRTGKINELETTNDLAHLRRRCGRSRFARCLLPRLGIGQPVENVALRGLHLGGEVARHLVLA